MTNKIYFGDNLQILVDVPTESVDLIYIDPPFNTGKGQGRTQIKTVRSENGDRVGFQGERYETIKIGTKSYSDLFDDFLGFLEPRLKEAYRILAPNGSMYFHIDYREVHYCKILLDTIFGRECFLNEIIWAYDYGARSKSKWPAKHDNILWYVKNPDDYIFNYEEIERIPRSTSRYAQRNLLLRNDAKGRFIDAGRQSGAAWAIEKVSRALVTGDIDNDGDLDLLVSNNGQPPDLLRNDGGRGSGQALLVKLRGRQSNRDAVGARVTAIVGSRRVVREVRAGSSYLGQNDLRLHFGLGSATMVERLEIRWPRGPVETIKAIAAQQVVTVAEGAGIVDRHTLN